MTMSLKNSDKLCFDHRHRLHITNVASGHAQGLSATNWISKGTTNPSIQMHQSKTRDSGAILAVIFMNRRQCLNHIAGFMDIITDGDGFVELENGKTLWFHNSLTAESEQQFCHPDVPSFLEYVQLEDADIVCFQRSLTAESLQQFCYPDVPSFLEYVHNRQVELSQPDAELRLLEVFYYRIYKLENGKTLWFHNSLTAESEQRFCYSDVPSFLEYVQVELSQPDAELRLLEVFYFRIYKPEDADIVCFQRSLTAESLQQFCYPDVPSFLEYVHNRQQIQNFGEPFVLVMHENRTLAELKLHIQKKFQVPDEEFAKQSDVSVAWEQYLGLDHSDGAPKRTHAAHQVELSQPDAELRLLEVLYYRTYKNRSLHEKPVNAYN